MNFNVRLKQLRQRNKLTQGELANILGLKPTAISNYESERNEPSFDKLISLSIYFDVSCDYLLGLTDSYLPVGEKYWTRILLIFLIYTNNYQEKVSMKLKVMLNIFYINKQIKD
ncbi:MAG: helix-turn-helix domain-containing protein [Mobilitalea sp.]